jgi:hypothetical protein
MGGSSAEARWTAPDQTHAIKKVNINLDVRDGRHEESCISAS